MNDLEKVLRKTLYKKSFYDFAKDMWPTFDKHKYVDGRLVKIYCEMFQYMCRRWIGYNGPEKKIVMPKVSIEDEVIDITAEDKQNININVPPRHMKSIIFNVAGPTWLWSFYPVRVVSVSHTRALASEMNSKRSMLINSEFYQEIFSEIKARGNASSITNNLGGEMTSISRDAFTGYGADIIINDDLTNAETARRDKAEMLSAWSYYQNTMPSRINDQSKYIIMNVQQRLAPNDITGHILENAGLASMYNFVVLPARFSKRTLVVCPISGDVEVFEKGSFLWPERFGDYKALEKQVGSIVFETQYLQNAIASDRTVVKPYMIIEKSVKEVPDISQAEYIYASHDFPVKDKDTSDFLGSILAYRCGSTIYIKECLEKRMAFVRSVEYVKQLSELYPGIIQIIEDKANGAPILQQLQNVVAGLQAYNPGTRSKMQRLESSTIYLEAKNVVFVKDVYDEMTGMYYLSEGLTNLKTKLIAFPFVEHDDIIDAFSMLLLYVFMDKQQLVYGRSFNDENIIQSIDDYIKDYKTIFFNKDGDIWKACEIAIDYSEKSKLVVLRDTIFKANAKDGLELLKDFAGTNKVFIDCSTVSTMNGMSYSGFSIEKYNDADFDKSVLNVNLAFSTNQILISNKCRTMLADIQSFKFSKTKDETSKYATTRDGMIACLRIALSYYGGIVY